MSQDSKHRPGRLSAPVQNLNSHADHATRVTAYGLIETLRSIRAQGTVDMTAIDAYDPDFSVKLSACSKQSEAEQLLDDWLARRMSVLKHTRNSLLRSWSLVHDAEQPSQLGNIHDGQASGD